MRWSGGVDFPDLFLLLTLLPLDLSVVYRDEMSHLTFACLCLTLRNGVKHSDNSYNVLNNHIYGNVRFSICVISMSNSFSSVSVPDGETGHGRLARPPRGAAKRQLAMGDGNNLVVGGNHGFLKQRIRYIFQ